jgi:isoleucyl-tRNA synthetase
VKEHTPTPAGRTASPAFDPDRLEREVLERWQAENTFEESLKRREGKPRYTFYDGPPYATGSPHYGHILQTTIKDAVTRYWTMRGYRVDRRVGWDCHGLPVETLVEKELGIKNKKDIEKLGVEKFNAACRAIVFRTVDEWKTVLQRMGRWADYEQAYATLEPTYMESVWWVFKAAWDAGLVTHGFRSSPYCPRCATPLSNFETAQGYRTTDDPAVTVKLRLKDRPATGEARPDGRPETFLLIWTTTPWTLPGNAAVAVHPTLTYARVRVGEERWIVAKDRLEAVVGAGADIEEEFPGSTLAGVAYEPLYTFLQPEKPAYRVVAADFVSATEGTGLVHIAPAFGEDDLKTAQKEDLPILRSVDENGLLTADIGPWAGLFVKDADPKIIADLKERGLLVKAETYRHEYPFCWRCDTPLIYYATNSWFIAVSKIRDELLSNNEQIHWVPEHLKEGRFGQGLKDAPDWAISRSRYWGTPIPVWKCTACGAVTAIGSIAELKKRGADLSAVTRDGALDLHRPFIDAVTFACPTCGGDARRVPDVFDVWMDSGSMPYAQWHYPFENRERVEHAFPADFIAEALDQTRGWFYTLHVLATILTRNNIGLGTTTPAFKNVVVSGLVLAEDGRKLSKKLKNYTDPTDVVRRFGADTLRLYLLSSTTIGEDYRLSDRLIETLFRTWTLPLWNVLRFSETYAGGGEGAGKPSLLDQWILARTAELVRDVRAAMDAYRLDTASRALLPFVDDLSNWYVRRSRKRFSGPDAATAAATLRDVLATFALVAAPFTPFLVETLYRKTARETSPHLGDFPEPRAVDEALLERMTVLRRIVSAGLEARANAGIKVRQPLGELVIVGAAAAVGDGEWRTLLLDEVNVRNLRQERKRPSGAYAWAELPDGTSVGVLTELSDELVREGIVREAIRTVQDLRKEIGLTPKDTIELSLHCDDPEAERAIAEGEATLLRETRARARVDALDRPDGERRMTLHGAAALIRLRRVPE